MVVPPYSVVVPVHDEARILGRTVPSLLAATEGDGAEVIFVCNGCEDDSADLLRALCIGRPDIRVLELPEAGKTAALDAGDAVATLFPRFYLDADVEARPGIFQELCAVLESGGADLVSPAIRWDLTNATTSSRMLARTWLALPHARTNAYHHLLGLSASGRARWGRFPRTFGDDNFIEAMIPAERRRVVPAAVITTRPPNSFRDWVYVRARWRTGERELARLGLDLTRTAGQRRAVLSGLTSRDTAAGVALHIIVRVCAEALSRTAIGRTWHQRR